MNKVMSASLENKGGNLRKSYSTTHMLTQRFDLIS